MGCCRNDNQRHSYWSNCLARISIGSDPSIPNDAENPKLFIDFEAALLVVHPLLSHTNKNVIFDFKVVAIKQLLYGEGKMKTNEFG